MGKTELATQLVNRAREAADTYRGIFWINAESSVSFQAGVWGLARGLGLVEVPELSAGKFEDIRDMVLQELNRSDGWLLVLDNLDEVALVESFMPERRGTRHVLITTRHRGLSSVLKAGQELINPMDLEEAVTLFKRAANHHQPPDPCSETQLQQLVEAVGFLPLAIIQAAAYLAETQEDISNYFRFYKSSRKDIWGWKPSLDTSYVTVAAVMAISFGKVKESEVSVRLFCLLSFLDAGGVPETLWTTSEQFQDAMLRTAFSSPANINSALQPLLVYNFVQRSDRTISMHRLVQDVMRDLIEQELQEHTKVLDLLQDLDRLPEYWIHRALELLCIAYPKSKPETWAQCESYHSNANCCIGHGIKYQVDSELFADLQLAVGRYVYDQGSYSEAKALFDSALRIYKRLLVDSDDKLSAAQSELGRSLAQLGQHHAAIEQYEKVLRLNDLNFAKKPIESALIIADVGKSQFSLGKYDEAIASLQRSLEITEAEIGPETIDSARIIGTIGAVYLSKKKFSKALKRCEKALRIHEVVLGKDHVRSAGLVCLLGAILHRKGHYRKALKQYERALGIYTASFGKDHIKSADTLDSIGLTYLHLGKCEKAREIFVQEMHVTESAFGRDHIKTEAAVWNIGASYLFSGDCENAVEYYERAIKITSMVLCEDHREQHRISLPDHANFRGNLRDKGAV